MGQLLDKPTGSAWRLRSGALTDDHYGVGPSLGEIARALGVTRKRVHDLVARLACDGRIQRQRGKARSIRPLTAREEAIRQLRDDGFIIDEDILSIRTPLTNAGLHLPPDLDHIPEWDGDGDGQDGQCADERGRNGTREGARGEGGT